MRKSLLLILLALFGLSLTLAYAQAPEGQEYVVQKDDWLSKIAEKEYGDPLAYPTIVEATNAKAAEDDGFIVITNPHVIKVGQKIWIPISTEDVAAPPPTTGGDQLTETQLKNATYSGIYDEPVTLTDGRYEGEPFVEGGASVPSVTWVKNGVAYVDLDSDGVDDAAVLLVENSGGTGVFTYVGVQLNVDGQPVDAGTVWVGDRTQVISMAIENGQVIMEIVTQGPNDPQCCPTLKVLKTYALQDGKLVEVSSEEIGNVSLDDLMGTSWALENLKFDQEPVLPDTEITVTFVDGQVSGSAGCNNYSASVSNESPGGGENNSQTLTVGPVVSTQMACPEPVMNQELQYLTALQGVTQWYYLPGRLALSYQTPEGEFGTLVFAPGAASMTASGTSTEATTAAAPTEVITYVPTTIPTEKMQAGSCFANAIGLGRADAWRCTVENNIYDPCFEVDGTVVCGADPVTGEAGFVLELTEPLPAPDPGNLSQAWLVELVDRQVCGLMTGTVVGVGDRVAPYGCPDQTYLFEEFQQERDVWLAEKAVIGLNDDGFYIEKSEMVPIVTVWQ